MIRVKSDDEFAAFVKVDVDFGMITIEDLEVEDEEIDFDMGKFMHGRWLARRKIGGD